MRAGVAVPARPPHGGNDELPGLESLHLLADFFDDSEKILKGVRYLKYLKHEPILFHVLAPDELDLPLEEVSQLVDMEDDSQLTLDPRILRQEYRRRIKAFLEGLYQAIAYLNSNPTEAQALTNDAVGAITGKALASGVVSAAWPHLAFTLDPLASTLKTSADHAHAVGLLAGVDLKGLYDLSLLNRVLAEHNQAAARGL